MSFEDQAAQMTREELVALLVANEALLKKRDEKISKLENKVDALTQQVEWYQRQYFGQKTEKRLLAISGKQLCLGEMLEAEETPPPPTESVKTYERRQRRKFPELGDDESQLRFDASVPVQVINVPNPETDDLPPEQYEVISEKVTYKLAQRRGPYVVLKYVRQEVKLKENGTFSCPPAPSTVIEKSVADVSFLAGLAIDKMLYHLPLYRQHQRLEESGIHLSRATLTNLIIRVSQLLEPVYLAQFSSILQSKVLGMDETPVKAGQSKPGKMQKGYFWPVYGDKDEIVFLFSASRGLKVVSEALEKFSGVLVTDGYKVYERFAEKFPEVTHAQCWAHTRRKFDEAKEREPALCNQALDYIGALYAIEALGRNSPGNERLTLRDKRSKPIVDDFFNWLSTAFGKQVLLPSNPFTKAANYALQRERALRVFLDDPQVPIDTNHVERALRPIPLGRKNWLFCWTELGARCVGILQSLIATCRIQEVNPYLYLVDVLQRIDTHPAKDVHLLMPRLWKENFAGQPLLSDLDKSR